LKRELILFLVIFLLLTGLQHPDIFTDPIARFEKLPEAGAYGFGMFHPLVFTLFVYLVVSLVWFFIRKLKNLIKNK